MTRQRKQRLEEAAGPTGVEIGESYLKSKRPDVSPVLLRTRLYDGSMDSIQKADKELRKYAEGALEKLIKGFAKADSVYTDATEAWVFSENDVLYSVVRVEYRMTSEDEEGDDIDISLDDIQAVAKGVGLPYFKHSWKF